MPKPRAQMFGAVVNANKTMTGAVVNDSLNRVPNGTVVTTSSIEVFDVATLEVETEGTIYTLIGEFMQPGEMKH